MRISYRGYEENGENVANNSMLAAVAWIWGYRTHKPVPGVRKSGIPALTETPAPLTTTTFLKEDSASLDAKELNVYALALSAK
jgi:hypothetical protein